MKNVFMAKEEQPAYKVANMGLSSVTNTELLSLIIGGTPDKAMEIARCVMAVCHGSLDNLARLQRYSFADFEGLGTARINAIMAAMEIGRRRQAEIFRKDMPLLNSSDNIAELLRPGMKDLNHEVADVVLMSQHYKLIKVVRLSEGGLTETAVDVRMIVREAVLCNATVIALAHNHPSGNRTPSTFDDKLTKSVKAACDTMRLHFVDHIIIAGNSYYSYMEEGRM